MPEQLLYYIWSHRLWADFPQTTTDGRVLEIMSVGYRNNDAGPDFTQVHLRIDGTEWIGNVEMHVRSSDWFKHHHDVDGVYDNIILHVVNIADKPVFNTRGESIVQCELQYPKNRDYIAKWLQDMRTNDSLYHTIACGKWLQAHPQYLTDGWRNALLLHRLDCKKQFIRQLLTLTQNDWNTAFYITLAHNFGFHTNGIPFESLALATPLSCLQKHRNSLFQMTALLLGQSGLLRVGTAHDIESMALLNEYLFLQTKFSLKPINPVLWKYARMRPQNFPQVRIRQFAQLLYQSDFLFSRSMECSDIPSMMDLLTLRPDTVDMDSRVCPPPPMGLDTMRVLIINTLLPYQYAYASYRGDQSQLDASVALYDKIPPENNTIIRQWLLLGQSVTSAADSQALIHLYQHFCQPGECIHCEVGHVVFGEKNGADLQN